MRNWILHHEEVHRLREKSVELTRKIFADLGAWQIAQLYSIHSVLIPWITFAWHFDEFDDGGDRAYETS
ncbi:hypothetical protein ACLK19_01440 [Escherichia coli]